MSGKRCDSTERHSRLDEELAAVMAVLAVFASAAATEPQPRSPWGDPVHQLRAPLARRTTVP